MKKGIFILSAMIILLGCSAGRSENQNIAVEKYEIGESVYVCGCPMMCCNSISKAPKGRCSCNFPLKQGKVSRVQRGIVYVHVSGLEKPFFVKNR